MVGSEVPAAAKCFPSLSPSILSHVWRHIGRAACSLEGLVAHYPINHVHHIIMLLILPHHLVPHCKFTLKCYQWLGVIWGFSSTSLHNNGVYQSNRWHSSVTRVPPIPQRDSASLGETPCPTLIINQIATSIIAFIMASIMTIQPVTSLHGLPVHCESFAPLLKNITQGGMLNKTAPLGSSLGTWGQNLIMLSKAIARNICWVSGWAVSWSTPAKDYLPRPEILSSIVSAMLLGGPLQFLPKATKT